jgi:hypothetical protein
MIKDKPPIEKLYSFFVTKKQFEVDIAKSGLWFDENLKKVFKHLDKKGEIDKSVIKNYKFICCEQYFKREVKYLLEDIELDVFHKTNVVAPNDLKCDYIEIQVKELIGLAKKTDSLIKEYSEINFDNLSAKEELLSKHINQNDKSTINIITLDDLIYDIISFGKIINSISVPNSDLVKLFDFNYSDIYITCLIEITNEIISVISRIIETSEYILESKYKIIKSPPFLILKEQLTLIEKQKPEFTISQIALKYAYESLPITRKNANDIAEKYGHKSGEKLFQKFTEYSSRLNRIGDPESEKKLKYKIKLIESVINILPNDKQNSVKDEVAILQNIYNARYNEK